MKREYMVVYEKGAKNWSAFSPDVPGCGSLGESLEETRANMREAIELYLIETAKAGEPIPEATATKVEFDEFDPGHETKQYFVEWLPVSLPRIRSHKESTQAA
jgi:predicted RNase H-like HicB family nuclease